MQLKALDLFCGAGGACFGMQWAGFEVFGVDIRVPTAYPGHFVQADALNPPFDLSEFDFIFASPPCQRFSPASGSSDTSHHPNLIPATRELLHEHPFTCIENVPQAPIRPDLILYGPQFGLGPTPTRDGLWRKRHFELSFWCWNLPIPPKQSGHYYSIAGNLGNKHHFYRRKAKGIPGSLTLNEGKLTMGIPMCHKMTRKEIANAVPPRYAHYIAAEAARQLGHEPPFKVF